MDKQTIRFNFEIKNFDNSNPEHIERLENQVNAILSGTLNMKASDGTEVSIGDLELVKSGESFDNDTLSVTLLLKGTYVVI